jgi:hypothetical protein
VGPILGQNYGARRYDRLISTMRDSLVFITLYTLVTWAVLALFRNQIADIFGATGEARDVIVFFCLFVAGSFMFNGMLFVANAAFNNLGYALYSTSSTGAARRWVSSRSSGSALSGTELRGAGRLRPGSRGVRSGLDRRVLPGDCRKSKTATAARPDELVVRAFAAGQSAFTSGKASTLVNRGSADRLKKANAASRSRLSCSSTPSEPQGSPWP